MPLTNGLVELDTPTIARAMPTVTLNVVKPSEHGWAHIVETNPTDIAVFYVGAGMKIQLWLYPTNVSFYRVFTLELPAGITNVTGYFGNSSIHIPSPSVNGFQLDANNSMDDTAMTGLFTFSSYPYPLSQGSWDYVITNIWTIPGSHITNYLMTDKCTSTLINASGDWSVTKYGLTITRSTNNVSW